MDTKRARGKCIANALVYQLCLTFLSVQALMKAVDTSGDGKIDKNEFIKYFSQ